MSRGLITIAAAAAGMGGSIAQLIEAGGWDCQHIEPRRRGFRSFRPYSRSKYRPHTAKAGSREAARRRRQIEKGMLQVSEPWERKDVGRRVKPHRSGGGYY